MVSLIIFRNSSGTTIRNGIDLCFFPRTDALDEDGKGEDEDEKGEDEDEKGEVVSVAPLDISA